MSAARSARDGFTAGLVPILVGAAVVAVVCVASVTVDGLAPGSVALSVAFVAMIAVGEVVRISLPGDRETAPIGAAGALAFALVPMYDQTPQTYSVAQVVAVTTVAIALGSIPHLAVGRGVRVDEFARRILVVAFVAAVFRPLLASGAVSYDVSKSLAMIMAAVALAGTVLDGVLDALLRAARDHSPLRTALLDGVRASAGIGSAVAVTGVLIALATPVMGIWALPVLALPLLLTQFSFRRYAAIRQTYLQTIRALSRVTEVGGYTETGHARRVSRLAVAMGRELGLSERELVDLEYAALMHDIGQLSLAEPIPGGATTVVSPEEQRQIAAQGGAVIRQTGVMDQVAVIVERQADPWRPRHGVSDDTLPLESRIIRVANSFDDLVGASVETDRWLQALERLSLGTVREFDPRVVETLSRIVERQSVLAPL